ncbi:class D sortase [Clostridium sp. DL1XJH146]
MKKPIKAKILSVLGILLISGGIFVICLSFFMRTSAKNKQEDLIENFEEKLEEQKKISSEETNLDNLVPSENVTEEDTTSTETITPLPVTMGAVGIIEIPKIDLKVAIGEGVDMDTLKYAVGHFPDTAMPGETGNFAVAGHRSYTYNQYFNRLDEVKTGDEILVTSLAGTFTYIVDDISVVEPDEVSVLSQTSNSSITLVTCTPVRVATHRLIIKGHLK